MINCYIGLGSNQLNPLKQLKRAIKTLKKLPYTTLSICSSFYQSSPLKMENENNTTEQDKAQDDYINAVVKLKTTLPPLELLKMLQTIEKQQGRIRHPDKHWCSRTLDLDILLYGDKVIHTQQLVVPHYAMKSRDFVLKPLFEIAAELMLPEGEKLSTLVDNCADNNLKKLA